jgi:hypothetical protein
MSMKRTRIFVRSVDSRICYARGRGFGAYVQRCKDAVEYSKHIHGEIICTVVGNKIYDPNFSGDFSGMV